jgi:hypothetical protein
VIRSTYLLLTDFERLEAWCKDVHTLFDREHFPYLVGSSAERADYRDIDLRLILDDDEFDRDWHDPVKLRIANHALSTWGQRETGLPIDFQIQRQTQANASYPGRPRNPMGGRDWRLVTPMGVSVDDPSEPAL